MIRFVRSNIFDNFILITVNILIKVIFNTILMASIGLISDNNKIAT